MSLSVHSPGWLLCPLQAKFKISCLWLLLFTAQSAMTWATFFKCTPQHEATPLGRSLAWAMVYVSPLSVSLFDTGISFASELHLPCAGILFCAWPSFHPLAPFSHCYVGEGTICSQVRWDVEVGQFTPCQPPTCTDCDQLRAVVGLVPPMSLLPAHEHEGSWKWWQVAAYENWKET